MKKDKTWLKDEVKSLFDEAYDSGKMEYHESEESIHRINSLVDQLDEPDEPEKPVIPQHVVDWIEEFYLQGSNPLKVYNELDNDFVNGWTTEEDAEVYHWIRKNSDDFIDSLRNGYCVEATK